MSNTDILERLQFLSQEASELVVRSCRISTQLVELLGSIEGHEKDPVSWDDEL